MKGRNNHSMKLSYSLTVILFFFLHTGLHALTMDWSFVGNPGNVADTEVMSDGTTGYGSVDYVYQIGTYEVTNSQYCEFLNAVAVTDTYGLYNTNMAAYYGGIVRSGTQGTYHYTVQTGKGNRPVNYVSWHDCLRFANWMHNGQPSGLQNSDTTEDGAYTFSGATAVSGRNSDALVWLTSEDEWYKAAYYKGGGSHAGYWNYATQSDLMPILEPPPGGSNSVNAGGYPAGGNITNVGAYSGSVSAYGTYDQCGNLIEWNETIFGPTQWGLRGGSFDISAAAIAASSREKNNMYYTEGVSIGFRLATIPEPYTLLLLGLGGMMIRKKSRNIRILYSPVTN